MTVRQKIVRRWARIKTRLLYSWENVVSCWCGGSLGPSRDSRVGECVECGTGVLRRRLTEASYDRWYRSGDYRRTQMGTVSVSVGQLIKELRRGQAAIEFMERHGYGVRPLGDDPRRYSVLDVGSGAGGFLVAAKIAGVGAMIGVDTDARSGAIPKEFGIAVSPYMPVGGRFDRVICSHLIEHVLSPVTFMRTLGMHLTDRGVLYVETPAWTPKAEVKLPHVYMYTAQSFRLLGKRAELEVVAITEGIQAVLRRAT